MTPFAVIHSRFDLDNGVYALSRGLREIGRFQLAQGLEDLYSEMENVDSSELAKTRIFEEGK